MLTSCQKFSTIVFLVLVAPVGNSSELPLFASDEVIDITFEVPMNTLVKEAERLPVVEGVLYYTGDDGQRVTLDLEMNTRGKSRLEYCQFPPLKINLKRKQTKGTLFAGQNKLKLVTRCRTGASFERYLYQLPVPGVQYLWGIQCAGGSFLSRAHAARYLSRYQRRTG